MAQKPWAVPIPGTIKLHCLTENIGAVPIELSLEELKELEMALEQPQIIGDRYPEHIEKATWSITVINL